MSSGGGILAGHNHHLHHHHRLAQAKATAAAVAAVASAANCRTSLISNNSSSSSISSSVSNSSTDASSTIISESEFPSLGVRSSPSSNHTSTTNNIAGGGNGAGANSNVIISNNNSSNSNSAFTPLPTTSSSSSPNVFLLQHANHHLHTKDLYSALQQRAPYANLMRANDGNSLSTSNVEFHMQNEDFPALPGATQQEMGSNQACNEGLVTDTRYVERSIPDAKTIVTFPDGTVKNIPPTMLSDQFGMTGLLTALRAIESDPGIVALALGHDLTSLGLNLNSTDRNIFTTFAGPWADQPCRIQDLEVKVPDDYLTNSIIRDKLPNIKLCKLSEDVLFYLFYNCPGEVYQVAAASELYSRDWRYHKSQCVWLTRSQYGGVKEQTSSYEKGSYNVFDPVQWRKIPKDMTLEYRELEERPKLPQSLQQTVGGQQAGQSSSTSVSQNGS